MKRRGFTLIELLVVVAIIALLIAILLPSLGKARELSNRSVCAANVRGIGQSMAVYSADNLEAYPMIDPVFAATTPQDGFVITGSGPGVTTGTAFPTSSGISQTSNTLLDATVNLMYVPANQRPNIVQNMWLLVMLGQVAPKQFVCKSDLASCVPANLMVGNVYQINFNSNGSPNDKTNSYSFDFPWIGSGTTLSVGGWWRNTTDAGLPILADMAPMNGSGNPTANIVDGRVKTSNSFNHQGDGQNVGFGDAHAEFQRIAACGQNNDNIYNGGATAGVAGPTGQNPGNMGYTSSVAPSYIGSGGQGGSWDVMMVPIANASNGYVRY